MLPPLTVKYGRLEGVADQQLDPLPVGAEYPHQINGAGAEDGPPSRLEFEMLKMRVDALTADVVSILDMLGEGK